MKYEGMLRPKAKAKEPSLDLGRDENRIRRVNKTYVELIQQPESFANTLDYTENHKQQFVEDLKDREFNKVILIGCGDSLFVGSALELLVQKLFKCVCLSYDAYEFFSHRCNILDNKTLVIGQSASGTTASVLGALRAAKECGAYCVGISNTQTAAILSEFDFGLWVQAKREGWPTQATTSAIGALALLFASLAVARNEKADYAQRIIDELYLLPNKIQTSIKKNEKQIQEKVSLFINDIFFQTAGCGALYGAAQISCAKLRELCPVHAVAHPMEEFHHYRTLKPGDPLVLFILGGNDTQKELDTALVGAYDGGKIIIIGNPRDDEMVKVSDLICSVEETLEELQPVLSVIPAHLFAYYLAQAKYEANIGYPERKING